MDRQEDNIREHIDALADSIEEEIILIDGFDEAIIGLSHDCRLIYSYDLMVEQFARDNGCSDLDAIEWIEYNTIPSLPYIGQRAPIILMQTIETIKQDY